MIPWADVGDRGHRMILGIVGEGELIDETLLECCAESHVRACFFTEALAPLRNLAVKLETFSQLYDEIEYPPGRGVIAKAYRRVEPSSSEALFRIIHAVGVIRDSPQASAAAGKFKKQLQTYFKHDDVLPPNSIIPSLHVPNLALIKEVQEKARIAERTAFSLRLLKDSEIPKQARLGFVGHLYDGYAVAKGNDPGVYKLTNHTARVFHRQLETFGATVPPLSDLLPTSLETGPRRGQVSKGLETPKGNLLRSEFALA